MWSSKFKLALFLILVWPLAIGVKERKSNEISARSLSKELPRISKPELLYLVGVEGSSHHGVHDILSRLGADRCREHNYPDVKGARRMFWLSNSTKCLHAEQAQNERTCPLVVGGEIAKNIFGSFGGRSDIRSSPIVYNSSAVLSIARDLQEVSPHKLNFLTIQGWSFPSGLGKSKRNPPWPISISKLFDTLSPEMTVRFIVLQRPFAKCVFSHRWWDGGLVAHALKLAEYLKYFGEVLNSIPREQWRILPVECLYKNKETREKILQRLMEYLDWRPDGKIECCGCLDGWRESREHNIKKEDRRKVALIEHENEQNWGVLQHSSYFDNFDQYFSNPASCL